MEIVELTKNDYADWDAFCLASDDAWFWHTSHWLEYSCNYKPELNPKSFSFFVANNGKIIAVCPLIMISKFGAKEFNFEDSCSPVPAFSNGLADQQRKKAMKLVFERIDQLARQEDISRASLSFSILSKSFIEENKHPWNYLMKFGYLDVSINTQVIDLSKGIDELRGNMSHGHDYDINAASKKLTVQIFDKHTIERGIFDEYVFLHSKQNGRAHRKKFTFDAMYDFILNGKGFLAVAVKGAKFVGFSYFFIYKNNAYYGSSCNDSDEHAVSISHLIQWEAIKHMKKEKFKFYELGLQYYADSLFYFPNEKEKSISKFKRGFGGFAVPFFCGEKYYDKDFFLDTFSNRMHRYASGMRKQ